MKKSSVLSAPLAALLLLQPAMPLMTMAKGEAVVQKEKTTKNNNKKADPTQHISIPQAKENQAAVIIKDDGQIVAAFVMDLSAADASEISLDQIRQALPEGIVLDENLPQSISLDAKTGQIEIAGKNTNEKTYASLKFINENQETILETLAVVQMAPGNDGKNTVSFAQEAKALVPAGYELSAGQNLNAAYGTAEDKAQTLVVQIQPKKDESAGQSEQSPAPAAPQAPAAQNEPAAAEIVPESITGEEMQAPALNEEEPAADTQTAKEEKELLTTIVIHYLLDGKPLEADGKEVMEQLELKGEDPALKADQLTIPEGYRLKTILDDLKLKAGQSNEINVELENAIEARLIIHYTDEAGNSVGIDQTIVKTGSELTVTSAQLQVPSGYQLEQPFEDVTVPMGKTEARVLVVVPQPQPEPQPAKEPETPADQPEEPKEEPTDVTPEEPKEEPEQTPEEKTEEPAETPEEKPEETSGQPAADVKTTVTIHWMVDGRALEENGKPAEMVKEWSGDQDQILDASMLTIPAGYQLKGFFEARTIAKGSSETIDVELEAIPVKKAKATIQYLLDGKVIGDQVIEGADNTALSVSEKDLKVPAGYVLSSSFKTESLEAGVEKVIAVDVKKESTPMPAKLKVVYYTRDNGTDKTIGQQKFTSLTTGEKGVNYSFDLEKSFKLKIPSGYVLKGKPNLSDITIQYGYEGTIRLEVTKAISSVQTATDTSAWIFAAAGLMGLGGIALLGWLGLRKKK